VSCKLLVGLAMVCGAPATIRAERAIMAEVPADAPFGAAQLCDAIRLRLATAGPAVRVHVAAIPGGVRIEARGNAREIGLRGLTGSDAARLVALVIDDLLLDDLATEPLAAPSLVRGAPGRTGATIGVLGGAAAWQHALGGLGVDVVVPRAPWLVAVEAGGATLVDGPVRLTAVVVRIGGGVRTGPVELRAGATLAPVIVSDGAGDWTILVGAGASARLRLPITESMRAVLAGGVDGFATRTTYVVGGMPIMATPRIAPWIGVGMEFTP
jgi:hypothetical protein